MSDIDINKVQQNIKELQDQNAIDFQQWKKLGQEIEKLRGNIKTTDTHLNLLMKKIETDYESLKKVIIDENIQIKLINGINENKKEINKKVSKETLKTEVNKINSELDNKANEADFTKLNNDFQNIVANVTNGNESATNSEIVLARTDFKGLTRTTVGEAVTSQIKMINDYEINNIETLYSHATFVHGQLNLKGGIDTVGFNFRVCSNDILKFNRNIKFNIKSGYRYGFVFYDNNVCGNWSGWFTGEYLMPKNRPFKVQIDKIGEDTTINADIFKYVSYLTFSPIQNDILKYIGIEESKENISWFNNGYQNGGVVEDNKYCHSSKFEVNLKGNIKINTNNQYIKLLKCDISTETEITNGWESGILEFNLEAGVYIIVVVTHKNYNDRLPITQDDVLVETTLSQESVQTLLNKNYSYHFIDSFKVRGYNAEEVLNYTYTGITRNGIAVYKNYLISCFNPNELMITDLSTKEIIADFKNIEHIQHGDCCQFLNEFYETSDEFPLLMVNTDSNLVNILRVTRTEITLIRSYKFTNDECGFFSGGTIDTKTNTLYLRGYYEYNYKTKTNNYMINTVWDLDTCVTNDDGTLKPTLLNRFKTPYLGIEQDMEFNNGKIYLCVSNLKQQGKEFITVLNAETGNVINYIDDIPLELKNSELEGISIAVENNEFVIYVSEYYKVFRFTFE